MPIKLTLLLVIGLSALPCPAFAEQWVATAYCPDKVCTGKSPLDPSYRQTASGLLAVEGRTVAVNWLPFGTRLRIGGKLYRVEDRGGVSHFGTKKNSKKRVDIYFESHQAAVEFGRRMVEVQVLGSGA
jgi:3D (Asp-Asp-Asp) domain-containing protein